MTRRASKRNGMTARQRRRAMVANLPRNFRVYVHGRGQWMKKVVNDDGLLERP